MARILIDSAKKSLKSKAITIAEFAAKLVGSIALPSTPEAALKIEPEAGEVK